MRGRSKQTHMEDYGEKTRRTTEKVGEVKDRKKGVEAKNNQNK
jgi:hypothetical protein